jgi:hypothetical protein
MGRATTARQTMAIAATTATAPTNDDSTSHADPLKSLEDLAVEYRDLCQKETELQLLMDRLEGEEESLSTALTQVEPAPARTTATKRSTGSQPISQQRQAMQRLELVPVVAATTTRMNETNRDCSAHIRTPRL